MAFCEMLVVNLHAEKNLPPESYQLLQPTSSRVLSRSRMHASWHLTSGNRLFDPVSAVQRGSWRADGLWPSECYSCSSRWLTWTTPEWPDVRGRLNVAAAMPGL
jgi:hypothetical protein